MALRLSDGTSIVNLSRPAQGLRHRLLFGVEEGSGAEVAAKIERVEGALGRERRVLEWLARADVAAPRPRGAGTVEGSGEFAGAFCLVMDRAPGGPATTLDGWERLGRALARLPRVPWEGSDLPIVDHGGFLALHERRVTEVGEALGRELGGELPEVPAAYAASPLTVTHGDPGPGNFVDDGARGAIVDWEDATVAPRGLDLGRARFIALLGGGPEGYVVEQEEERARAVTAGFGAAAEGAPPGEDELAWWLAVAGVQFTHWRLERAGRPGIPPWLDAVAVLKAAL
jgi:aminoglycoside phosphotransferase (APT) family kinase protein